MKKEFKKSSFKAGGAVWNSEVGRFEPGSYSVGDKVRFIAVSRNSHIPFCTETDLGEVVSVDSKGLYLVRDFGSPQFRPHIWASTPEYMELAD